MKIVNKRRFLNSCIFFILLMVIFSNNQIISKAKKSENIIMAEKTAYKNGEGKEIFKNDYAAMEKNNEELDKESYSSLLSRKDKNTVVLDAGHGGKDKGTNIGTIYEKTITFKIVKYAESYLKEKGYNVILTRNEDKLIPLKEIGNIVNASKACKFVSVHVNSFKESKYKGVTTYYYAPYGKQKQERIEFAHIVQDEMIKSGIWYDRGIQTQNIAVLRYSDIPCVLVECGFLTNPDDRTKLLQEKVLKNLGESIAKGIINYQVGQN